jgi:CoA:oxalate CoA-transferase
MESNLPLKNLVVLDLSRVLAGPYCTMVLADMGARVFKIEHPEGGDDSRAFGPFVGGESAYFMSLNRNKLSMTMNLKHPRAKQLFLAMVRHADVVVENFRPGAMERLGLGYETLRDVNPRIVYAAVSGFGHSGPYMLKPCYDIVAQAMGGLMSITGHPDGPPTRVGASVGDITAALFATIGILAALRERDGSGQGQKIDVAMLDCQVAILENAVSRYLTGGEVPGRIGNRHPSITPFSSLATADGWVIVAAGNDSLWARLCGVIGRPDLAADPRFATNGDRTAHWSELEPLLTEAFGARTTAEWLAALEGAGIPSGPINDVAQVINDPQVNARGMIQSVEHPVAGPVAVTTSPVKMSRTPVDREFISAPGLGEHTAYALGELLGLSLEQVAELRREGAL